VSHLSARVVPAYAKLNLSLSVTGRRADGFHDIDSVLVPIDWHDLVGVSITLAATEAVALKVTGTAAAGVPTGDSNLTVRAARALMGLAGRPLDIRLWVNKTVPHGAGLGGGSGDAAAVLRAGTAALAALHIATDPDEVAAAALAIGSDVPALLDLGAHRVRGRGERLQPLRTPHLHVVVASTVPSSTAATYGALLPAERHDDGRTARLAELLAAHVAPDRARMSDVLGSALEGAACRADAAVAAAVQRARATRSEIDWHMTGSGGALFAIVADAVAAEGLTAAMRTAGFNARACRTIG
jgi:4-diphosphocytidyl-2-C-methyl-D-erythritol kinase